MNSTPASLSPFSPSHPTSAQVRPRGGSKVADADNSARNVRDRNDRTLTTADQGGRASDVKITQQIRHAVTAGEGFSVNAKNAKIITVDGRVTLRGPVRTAGEKSAMADLAVVVVGAGNVDDRLEITAR